MGRLNRANLLVQPSLTRRMMNRAGAVR